MAEEKSVAAPESSFDLMKFLGEVRTEMKRVQWPSRHELSVDTAVVAVAVVLVSLLVWVSDTFFSRLFSLILR